MTALEGVRILDLSGGIAGPLGVLQLAEHGADVIKIEPPGGTTSRDRPSSHVYNRSRRSVTLDLEQPEGVALFRELCATADVLVEAFAPATMAGFDLDYESLHEDLPRLVYCSVPAWPSGTRYRDLPGYEALIHARSGQQRENTSVRPGPVFLHSPVASFGAMFLVPIGIMSALLARDETGRGQHVEVSLLQGVLSLTTQVWNWTELGGGQTGALAKTSPAGIHQQSIFECANGEWIHASTMSGVPATRSEGSILGIDDIDPRTLATMAPEQQSEYRKRQREAYKRHDRAELIREFHAAGLGAEAIVEPHEHFEHPQLQATGSVVEVVDSEVGPTTQLGQTIFLEGTPGAVQSPQPLLGQHTDEVLRSLGHDDEELDSWRAKGII